MNQQSLANSAGATSPGPALDGTGARPSAGAGGVANPERKDRQLERKVYTAGKEHACTLCKTPIHPGQKYMRILTLLAEGGVMLMKYHEPRPPGEDECILNRKKP